ncbi:hypothetical protein [Oligoflexus tunisiensis]|uniref:hypothetical protein n=1 Tax=Oligoflexus tunisiensis TaxID=708132 RepID=UPI00114CEF6B|nr:hypothetical protein [Oligoflexus tunisiensis]
MNKYKQLLIVLTICGLSGAWKTNFKLTNKFLGDSSDKYPANEKDYAYLFCETGEGADNSQKGKADWRRSKAHDYCWNEHKGSDDTVWSGWERSRLMRGCKSQLNFFGNKIYRCYDITKDPEFSQIEQALVAEKKQAYDEWLTIYNAKVDELYKGANQTYGDVDVELKAAQEKEQRAKDAKEKMEKEAALAKRSIDELSARHAQMDKLLSSLVGQFDSGWASLLARVEKLESDIKEANSQMAAFGTRLKASDQSHASISAIQSEAASVLQKSYSDLCKGLEISKDVETLRTQVAYMNRLVDPILADAEAVHIPESFSESRASMLGRIQSLYDIPGKRDFIFDSSYDVLSERPPVCDDINAFLTDLGKAAAYAKRVEEIKKTTGVIADFEAAVKQIEIEKEAEAQYQAALLGARDIEARWVELLQRGRVLEARTIIDNLDQSLTRIMSSPELLQSHADLKKLTDELNKFKARILEEAGYRLSLNGAHTLISIRLRQIKVAIMKLEMKSRQKPALNAVWSLQKQEVLSAFNTKPGQDIFTPVFKDWQSLLEYDQMIDRVAASMDQLLAYNP